MTGQTQHCARLFVGAAGQQLTTCEGIAQHARAHVRRSKADRVQCVADDRTEQHIVDRLVICARRGEKKRAVGHRMTSLPCRKCSRRESGKGHGPLEACPSLWNGYLRPYPFDDHVAPSRAAEFGRSEARAQQQRYDSAVAAQAGIVAGVGLDVALEGGVCVRIEKERLDRKSVV